MPDIQFKQHQKTSQTQVQRLSQLQIQTLNLIGMSSMDLRNEILEKAEKNPAIEITQDPFAEGVQSTRRNKLTSIDLRLNIKTKNASKASLEAADNFQALLESSPDMRETLQEHLLFQLEVSNLDYLRKKICEHLIYNLDEKGHHILAPETILTTNEIVNLTKDMNIESKRRIFAECINTVQHFDPAGICCKDVQESLELQAKLAGNIPPLVLFFLHGNLEILATPSIDSIQRKLFTIKKDMEKLAFQKEDTDEHSLTTQDITKKNIEQAIAFIKKLDPFPTKQFGYNNNISYIRPDITVTRHRGVVDREDFEHGIIIDSDKSFFRILPVTNIIPNISISSDFANIDEKKLTSEERESVGTMIKDAKAFMDSLDFRQATLIQSMSQLVHLQLDFFRHGPGNLKPLTQREFSALINVHESTVSRIADNKYISCHWGIFPVKYFFSTAIQKNPAFITSASQSVSSEKIRSEIKKILDAQKQGEKPLSDQKISDILAQKGYKVARRTVSKYRAMLNIDSSYTR